MGYLAFFCLNFIVVMVALKVSEPIFGLNAITALLAVACVWVIPTWRWNNCMWNTLASDMKKLLY